MLTSPEAHSLHTATQAGEMPNKLTPDQNANGPVPSKRSVPTEPASVEVITVVTGERVCFIPYQRVFFMYKWDSQNV